MKANLKWQIVIASALALTFAAGVSAQSITQSADDAKALLQATRTVQSGESGGAGGSVGFATAIFGGKVVTNAPYSAQIITESVQPFADGNAITHTSTSSVWRDSQGRTRREQNINMIGPSQTSGAALQFITIDDPVSGIHYTLNPAKMIATQFVSTGPVSNIPPSSAPTVVAGGGGNVSFSYSLNGNSAAAGPAGTYTLKPAVVSTDIVTTESLGADTMQGLTVLGTRITRTIPAGQIGNALPILIITDKWYSQDLQIDMKMVHSDPRTGTTTTTVTNISRNEPPLSMFTLPPGYTIANAGMGASKVTLKQQEPL
jgi:hypothetical protein